MREYVETRDEIGNVRIESEFHGCLLDTLEGVGRVDRLPGVVEVVDPDSREYGPVDADLVDLMRHVQRVYGWEPMSAEAELGEWWEVGELMIGDAIMLHPIP